MKRISGLLVESGLKMRKNASASCVLKDDTTSEASSLQAVNFSPLR